METATEWATLELKAGEVRWMLHAPIRVRGLSIQANPRAKT
jgi:hypothetical protein